MSDIRADIYPLHTHKSSVLPVLNSLDLQRICWNVQEIQDWKYGYLLAVVIKLYTDKSICQSLCYREIYSQF